MLLCSLCLYIFFYCYFFTIGLAVFQHLPEFCRLYTFLETEIYFGARLAIKDIISLVLCDMFSKMLTYIFKRRMALDRKIATFPRIQKVKADRKFFSKKVCMFAKYLLFSR